MGSTKANFDALIDALMRMNPLASEDENPEDAQEYVAEPAETYTFSVAIPPDPAAIQQPHFGLILVSAPPGGELRVAYSSEGQGFRLRVGEWFKIGRGARAFNIVEATVAGDYDITIIRDRWFEPSPAACCNQVDPEILATQNNDALSTEDGDYILLPVV